MTKECEVKCKYHWDIVQNKYENLMMLHIWILRGKDLFNMGIYRLVQTKIYFTVYFHVCETQRTRTHMTDTTATPNGHQMAVVTWDRSITDPCQKCLLFAHIFSYVITTNWEVHNNNLFFSIYTIYNKDSNYSTRHIIIPLSRQLYCIKTLLIDALSNTAKPLV